MRNRLLLLGLVLLLAIPLTLILSGFARAAIVVPVMYILWLGNLILQSIPQALLWALLLAIALLISVRSLGRGQRTMKAVREVELDYPGQVGVWARRIRAMTRGGYYERHLVQHLGRLSLAVLAYHERLSYGQVRQHLEAGDLDVPAEIRAYLKVGLRPESPRVTSLFSRLIHRLRPNALTSPLDLEPERVVQFLEYRLEVQHDPQNR